MSMISQKTCFYYISDFLNIDMFIENDERIPATPFSTFYMACRSSIGQ